MYGTEHDLGQDDSCHAQNAGCLSGPALRKLHTIRELHTADKQMRGASDRADPFN